MILKKNKKFDLSKPALQGWFFFVILVLSLLGFCLSVEAADLMAGTTKDAIDTMKGAGRTWIYLIDFAISLAAFATTKKPFVFFSVLGVAIAMTAVFKLIGE